MGNQPSSQPPTDTIQSSLLPKINTAPHASIPALPILNIFGDPPPPFFIVNHRLHCPAQFPHPYCCEASGFSSGNFPRLSPPGDIPRGSRLPRRSPQHFVSFCFRIVRVRLSVVRVV